jgi:hypothetical protein
VYYKLKYRFMAAIKKLLMEGVRIKHCENIKLFLKKLNI